MLWSCKYSKYLVLMMSLVWQVVVVVIGKLRGRTESDTPKSEATAGQQSPMLVRSGLVHAVCSRTCCMMVTCPIDVGCVLVAVGVHPGIAKTK